ncbi:NADPH:quinone reductase-like Zn-dependent oxidoreductase [Sphingomonas zeicaulis]|uniref:quinone oxidoreductase family protein n=1 Tax=Sphingomonas zeicaulis TaxID=1632740 RepID=UPI003D1F5971
MKAVIVQSVGETPVYGDFADPVAGPGESVVAVRAAPLSPIVRALAAGQHYSGGAAGGFVPGVDGVGIDPAGRRVYFLFPKAPFGSMAERALVSDDMMAPVPDGIADAQAAAIVTGGLASWTALTRRARLTPGMSVLINGVTGAAGAMAAQVARHLGAGRVIGVGRDLDRLAQIALDGSIPLDDEADQLLRAEFDRGVDVVLDFLWGAPAARIIAAATRGRGSPAGEPRIRYVQLGTVAGGEVALRGDALRGSGLELLGSGIGSVARGQLIEGASELLVAAGQAGFRAPAKLLPFQAAADAWNAPPGVRYILSPASDTNIRDGGDIG